jgi:hypothetical protein
VSDNLDHDSGAGWCSRPLECQRARISGERLRRRQQQQIRSITTVGLARDHGDAARGEGRAQLGGSYRNIRSITSAPCVSDGRIWCR